MTIIYRTDQKKIGLGTKVQLTGEVVQITSNFEDHIILEIEVTEFQKL